MTYYIVLYFVAVICSATDNRSSYSFNHNDEEILNLNNQRREVDSKHRNQLAMYIRNKCPEFGAFGLWERFNKRNWVNQCEQINNALNESHEQLVSLDNKIELLKLKKSE